MSNNFNEVAQQFVQFYYKTFDENRAGLSALYRAESMLTFETTSIQGAASILEKLTTLPFQKVAHQVSTLDAQPTNTGGIVVMVTGALLVDEEAKPMSYSQTFQLLPDGAGSYFVFNDIFRLISASLSGSVTITSYIIRSQSTGSRTIVNYNELPDYSKSWAQGNGYQSPWALLHARSSLTLKASLLCCTWGAKGALSLDRHSMTYIESPAFTDTSPVVEYVDIFSSLKAQHAYLLWFGSTMGTGDTFIAENDGIRKPSCGPQDLKRIDGLGLAVAKYL
ncbi:nuclear transport factor 2 [Uncinocarpus reesii 1704]|uniref:Nuclear transport factor 2 n=1 Tax=Uncinocarpus reesii (strain UAMH 1704) TaxID=336963 RepID=C4JYZ2_UNCRE|nr:nuclear transport factor 2 [Uncinocarpus reesii 1704]EEP82528.1 nuclear transport factor 2 [Uncinocarpus reesii 1704]